MRLKSIKLVGFKSFVDATTVPFPSNMTAIVGPNGCGKSNIIDAVRWVMGESSARYLRGESMTDVIFNGSTGRQPVGQASIELLFDNSEGRLGGEHGKFAELSIKRKVTRDGLSQYYLNGAKCRRRDVTDIFLGTGMGPRSYAIIEQGMISRLIESRPEELRVYLEEAAGISKYKERRKETEHRMKRTEENLERLSDIRDELDKQLQHLKRQARAAEKYAEYKAEERLTQARSNALQWTQLNQQTEAQQRSIMEYEQGIETLVFDKASNEASHEALRTTLEERQEASGRQQARYYETGAEVARIEQQLKFQKQRLLQQNTELAHLQEQRSHLKAREAHDAERLVRVVQTLDVMAPEIELLQQQFELQTESLSTQEQTLRTWQEEWDRFNDETSRYRHVAELAQSRMQQAEARIRQHREKRQTLEREGELLRGQLVSSDNEDLWARKAALEEQQAELEHLLEQRRQQIQALRQEIETVTASGADTSTRLSEQRAVLASLQTLQEGALGDALELQEIALHRNGVGTARLLERAQVSQGWEVAVEHVLADWLQAIVVEDDAQAWQAVLEQSLHRLTLISEHRQRSLAVSGGRYATLADVVSGLEVLLPILGQVRIVDTDDEAFACRDALPFGHSVVARSGLWLADAWLRTPQRTQSSDSLIARQERIHELELELPELERQRSVLADRLSGQSAALHELEHQLHADQQRQRQLAQESSQLGARLSAEEARQSQIRLRVERSEQDHAELCAHLEAEQESLAESRTVWEEAMASLDALTQRREPLLQHKERTLAALEQTRSQQRALQERIHQARMQEQMQVGERSMLEQSLRNIQDAWAQLENRQFLLESGDRVDVSALHDLEAQLEGLLASRLQDEEKLALVRREMEQVTQAIRQNETARHQMDARLQERRSALEALRMNQQALRINQDRLRREIEHDGFALPALLDEMPADSTTETFAELLTALADRVQRLGPINLAAIDEYQSQSERKEYLDRQHAELTEALATLQNAIRRIDRETRSKFKETYDQVNDGLQRLFPKIFGGGSASLSLTDDDLLETGVSILARPPGKKNATIHLLSGGEKALTALALIFAIFELNPAPFCMLDEVDAPLDDANVGRFANLVREMSRTVQFIYISHNKVSMEQADQLMGVTMLEPGVSRLVSVNVEEAAALVEA
jgi:chromosome segregation protein